METLIQFMVGLNLPGFFWLILGMMVSIGSAYATVALIEKTIDWLDK